MKLDHHILKSLSLISQVGLLMAIPVIGCILLGHYLDQLLGTNILFLIIFTILGTMAAFRNLFMLAKKQEKKNGKKDKNE